jgi:hypothetical protein
MFRSLSSRATASAQRDKIEDDVGPWTFRARAEDLLCRAAATQDSVIHNELVSRAAILHHLALMCESQREITPFLLREFRCFARNMVDAPIIGQAGPLGLRRDDGKPEDLARRPD